MEANVVASVEVPEPPVESSLRPKPKQAKVAVPKDPSPIATPADDSDANKEKPKSQKLAGTAAVPSMPCQAKAVIESDLSHDEFQPALIITRKTASSARKLSALSVCSSSGDSSYSEDDDTMGLGRFS